MEHHSCAVQLSFQFGFRIPYPVQNIFPWGLSLTSSIGHLHVLISEEHCWTLTLSWDIISAPSPLSGVGVDLMLLEVGGVWVALGFAWNSVCTCKRREVKLAVLEVPQLLQITSFSLQEAMFEETSWWWVRTQPPDGALCGDILVFCVVFTSFSPSYLRFLMSIMNHSQFKAPTTARVTWQVFQACLRSHIRDLVFLGDGRWEVLWCSL